MNEELKELSISVWVWIGSAIGLAIGLIIGVTLSIILWKYLIPIIPKSKLRPIYTWTLFFGLVAYSATSLMAFYIFYPNPIYGIAFAILGFLSAVAFQKRRKKRKTELVDEKLTEASTKKEEKT